MSLAMSNMTSCNLCGGLRPGRAEKCPYCGTRRAEEVEQEIVESGELLSNLMLGVLGLSAMLMVVYIAPMHPLNSPLSKLLRMVGVTSFALAILGLKDAVNLERGRPSQTIYPVLWFFGLLFAWPVMLPLYFRLRSTLGGVDRGKLPLALVAVMVAVLLSLLMSSNYRENAYRPIPKKPANVIREHWPVTHHGPGGHQHKME